MAVMNFKATRRKKQPLQAAAAEKAEALLEGGGRVLVVYGAQDAQVYFEPESPPRPAARAS